MQDLIYSFEMMNHNKNSPFSYRLSVFMSFHILSDKIKYI